MDFTITQKELAMLQEKSKLFNYLSSSFTKTYFAIGDGKFTVFFRGAKGALKFSFGIAVSADTKVFQVDYVKWLNAITKLSFADEVTLSLTEKSLKISLPSSTDMISLGIISYASDSSEAVVLKTFIEENAIASNKLSLQADLAEAISATSSMFSSAGHNNAIALKRKSIMYADRSIVLEASFDNAIEFIKEGEAVELHKYSAGFMLQALKFGSDFFFSDDKSTIYWQSTDGNMSVVLITEACEIAIPTSDELASIRPTSGGSFDIDHRELYNALEFFNGFYEASVWKPITFDIGLKETRLHYKHPTTEISKELNVSANAISNFAIGSENLSRLLSQSIDRSGASELKVHFEYDSTSAGVRCIVGDYYDITFAKLVS